MLLCGKTIIVAVAACAIVACASAPVTANKDTANIKPIGKTYIVVNAGDVNYVVLGGGKVGKYLADNMEKSLKQRSVEAKATQLGGLELDNNVTRDAKAYGASTLISMDMVDGTVNRDNLLVYGTFILAVFDVGLNKTVWKGKLGVSKGFIGAVGGGELDELIKKFLDAMKADGLFLGEAAGS